MTSRRLHIVTGYSVTMTNEDCESQERSEGKNDENENSPHFSSEIENTSPNIQRAHRTRPREDRTSQNIQGGNRSRPRDNKTSQDYGRKRQLRDDLPPEIIAAGRQMDEAFDFIKKKKDDEYEMFGRLIASKIKKISNPNTRDFLMNDIHNLVFRTCMADRLEQQSLVPQFPTSQTSHHQVLSQSPNPSPHQSPPGQSYSPHHQVLSQSPNPSTYQSPSGQSTSHSLHHQVFSPPPNPFTHLSPPGQSTSHSSHNQVFSPSPNPSTHQSPPGQSTSHSSQYQVFSSIPNPFTYQSLPGPSTSQTLHHQVFSPSSNPSKYQSLPHHEINSPSSPLDHFPVQSSQENFLESARASQIVITDTGEIKIIKN
ncbi:unnamed protein product [Parnassius apollo]|uniref:(apollo) hypothetical protein n=1 Tax=Parnassius apollo TaxID=110799 RepID=A0A8S3XHU0_PARAO|nr:unnamed protein product [Parnassius apollo]